MRKKAATYTTGRPCKFGHENRRYVSTGGCVECNRIRCADPERREITKATNRKRYHEDAAYRAKAVKNTRAYQSTPIGRARLLLKSVASRCRDRGLQSDITVLWLKEKLDRGVCELTGIPFDLELKDGTKNPFSPSLDRIDNNIGYLQSNCRMILWALNVSFNWWGEDALEPIMWKWLETRQQNFDNAT